MGEIQNANIIYSNSNALMRESKLKDFVKHYEISLSKGFTSKRIASPVVAIYP